MHAILIAGAALVGLPILLHLIMKQEPKRLTFPAFRFLKQKLKTNQRKLRLRHFILLALRMLIIALFCLLLYQPTFKSDQLNIRGEQPIATVIIIDTTPSMGYVSNDKTRLKEATQRASELIKELPDKSPIAILDTAKLNESQWLPVGDRGAPQRVIDELTEPKGGESVTAALNRAYQLLAKVDQETEAPEPLPKLVVVFTDRTVASWDANRTEDLKKLRDAIPDPKPVHVVLDFGVDAPSNVAILSAEMKPQIISANQAANIVITVGAAGNDRSLDVTVQATLAGSNKSETKAVSVPPGQPGTLTFEFRDLKPGLQQVEFNLQTPDKLMFDNKRFFTFKVGEARRILTITDDPEAAAFWQAAHIVKDEFSCLVVVPDQVEVDTKGTTINYGKDQKSDIREFEAVCLLNVRDPLAVNAKRPNDGKLWDRLRPYLQGGGKLIIIPGPDIDPQSYNAANDLIPGKFEKLLRTKGNEKLPQQKGSSWPDGTRPGNLGVTWVLDETALKHPMLKVIEDWKQQKSNLDIVANPRTTNTYWEVKPDKTATPIVYYNDAEKPDERHPAILERPVLDPKDNKPKGKVALLTTRMDVMAETDKWHDYWEQEGSTFFATFPYLLVRYLAGDTADANFNYPTTATVSVPIPRSLITQDRFLIFNGPGVGGQEARPTLGEKQAEFRIGPPKTNVAGNFILTIEETKTSSTGAKEHVEHWKDGFSVNVPPEESNLKKVDVAAIEEITDKDRVFAIERNSSLHDWLTIMITQPVDLFPWLLIAVLLLFVAEGLAANRFYRRPKA